VRYIVATETTVLSGRQPARLYKITGYRSRAELAASGTVDQMQALADDLNGESSE